ncbi:hypothetical protein ACNKHM_23300 [Shigella sonnei]
MRKPQGALEDGAHRWHIRTNDELKTAADTAADDRLQQRRRGSSGDVATVTDSVQEVRNAGMTNAKPAIC